MKQMKTILGTCMVTALLLVTRTEASTVDYTLDQSGKHETHEYGIDHDRETNSDKQHGQPDFLPPEKWEEHGDKGKHAGFDAWKNGHESEGWHNGFDGWHNGHQAWDNGHKGWDNGHEGWGKDHEGWDKGHEGWHHKYCHEKPVPEVPVPAAFWLFGSGMLLLGRVATRRRA